MVAVTGCVRWDGVAETTPDGTTISWTGDPLWMLALEKSNSDEQAGDDIWIIQCASAPCIESPLEVGRLPSGAVEEVPLEGPLPPGDYIVWMLAGEERDGQMNAAFHFTIDEQAQSGHPLLILLEALRSTT